MKLLLKIPGALAAAFMLASTATVAVQLGGMSWAWSRSVVTSDKLLRYAGVMYGLDPLDLTPPKPTSQQQSEPETREEILADRVRKTPRLSERTSAISQRTDEVRGITLNLRRNREKYVDARDRFELLLDKLEQETAERALRDVQITVEVVAPKHAKEILRAMLTTPPVIPGDNVMTDVVGIMKSLPDDRLKKILAEFKSDEERQLLHQILVEVGDLDDRNKLSSRSTP